MEQWENRLLKEYKEGKKTLKKRHKSFDKEDNRQKEDRKLVSGMIRSMDFVIKRLETGFFPEDEHRQVLYDPDLLGRVDEYAAIDAKIDKELEEKRRGTSRVDCELEQ